MITTYTISLGANAHTVFCIGPSLQNNIMLWHAVIFGPEDTLWDGLVARILFEFTEDYPNKAPNVKFLTRIFHPVRLRPPRRPAATKAHLLSCAPQNVYADGSICLDILQNQWSPMYDMSAVLASGGGE